MNNTPSDIIVKAYDLIGREVRLTMHSTLGLGGVWVKLGTLVGVDETTGEGQLIIENYRDASGHTTMVIPRVLIGAAEIIDIGR